MLAIHAQVLELAGRGPPDAVTESGYHRAPRWVFGQHQATRPGGYMGTYLDLNPGS
jgi:hypothetical protein